MAMLGLDVRMEVLEVELDPVAQAVAEKIGGIECRQLSPHDVWEWAVDEERTKGWLREYGELDMMLCGWTCVDMSSANKKGKGLQGQKSNVFFAARETLRIARSLCHGMEFVFECTWWKGGNRDLITLGYAPASAMITRSRLWSAQRAFDPLP